MKTILISLLLATSLPVVAQTTRTATVTDEITGEPLVAATIRYGLTGTGTITNAEGYFDYPTTLSPLIISYVGYKTDTIAVTTVGPTRIRLKPMDIRMPEIVVAGDQDPALAIIRQAIERKSQHNRGLKSFTFSAYSKSVLYSGKNPAFVQEVLLDGVSEPGKPLKEFIRSVRKTENMKKSVSAPTLNEFPDLYQNRISFGDDLTIIMPLATDAFSFYTYRLESVRTDNQQTFYQIRVIPLSNELPLVEGSLTIDGNTYALAGADLANGQGVRFPYLEGLLYRVKQVFHLQDGFWIPGYTENRVAFTINLGGLIRLDELDFRQTYTLTDVKINADIPDPVKKANRSVYGGYTTDTSTPAEKPRWMQNQRTKKPVDEQILRRRPAEKPMELTPAAMDSIRPVPLTGPELIAFRELDSTKTLETLIKPEGPLAGLATVSTGDQEKESPSWWEWAKKLAGFRNNRVEGLVPTLSFDYDSLKSPWFFKSTGGFALAMKQPVGEFTTGWYSGSDFLDHAWVSAFHRVSPTRPVSLYQPVLVTVTQSVLNADPWDYVVESGWSAGFRYYPSDTLSLYAGIRDFTVSHERAHRPWSVFNRRLTRLNPSFAEGRDRQVTLGGWWLSDLDGFDPALQDGFRADVVLSSPGLGSDFSYTLLNLAGQVRIKTFFSEALLSPDLTIRAAYSGVWGATDTRLLGQPETALRGFSLPGTFIGLHPGEVTATQLGSVWISHNWRGVLFQGSWLKPLREKAIEVQTFAGIVNGKSNQNLTGGKMLNLPYGEAGIGISRLFGFLSANTAWTTRKEWVWSVGFGVMF